MNRTFFLVAFTVGLVACGGAPPPPATAPLPATTTALPPADPNLASATWVVGHWAGNGQQESWYAAGPALFGIGMEAKDGHTSFWEVMRIDAAKGEPRFVAMPRGKAPTAFTRIAQGPTAATYARESDEYPKLVSYERKGDDLVARIANREGTKAEVFPMKSASAPAPAPELEAADRAFDEAVHTRGLDAWVEAFDDAGIMDHDGAPVRGREAIREAMAPAFARGFPLRWQPSASVLSTSGDVGFTIGRYAAGTETGTYVTVWHRTGAGPRILFDTGYPDRK